MVRPAPALLSRLALALLHLTLVRSTAVPRGADLRPATVTSAAFTLIADVPDPCRDLSASIQGWVLTSVHVGAGEAMAALDAAPAYARVWYQNGTDAADAAILTDGGSPLFPSGLQLLDHAATPAVYPAANNAGPGTAGVHVGAAPPRLLGPGPGAWTACNTTLPYYGNATFFVLLAWAAAPAQGPADANVPAACVPVRLLPQAALLQPLPPGSLSDHSFVQPVQAYPNVSAIEWSRYG